MRAWRLCTPLSGWLCCRVSTRSVGFDGPKKPKPDPDASVLLEASPTKPTVKSCSWAGLGLHEGLRKQLLEQRLAVPTAIQNLAFPLLHSGEDTYCAAATGTGKTFAYLLPLVQRYC
eukprot:RCo021529